MNNHPAIEKQARELLNRKRLAKYNENRWRKCSNCRCVGLMDEMKWYFYERTIEDRRVLKKKWICDDCNKRLKKA